MSSAVLKLSKTEIKKLKNYYADYLLNKKVPYSEFSAKKNGTSITAYTSGKVLFQGKNAEQEAARWGSSDPSAAKTSSSLPKNFAVMKLEMAATSVHCVFVPPMLIKNILML